MSGELIQWGGTNKPIGTLEEIKAAGLNPEKVCSCSPTIKGSGIRSCAMEGACKFDRPRYGGFKFTRGPCNIGFEVITGDTLPSGEAVIQQGACPCYVWVSRFQKRAEFGAAQRADGKPGEIITIIGQEGDEIEMQIEMPINVNGEVIKQTRDMFDTLDRQGIKINRDDRRDAFGYVMVAVTDTVPHHPRPGERPLLSYTQRRMMAANERVGREREIEDAIITGGKEPRDMATPERRGAGRPRKDAAPVTGLAEPVDG
jgi:hypothetical protein